MNLLQMVAEYGMLKQEKVLDKDRFRKDLGDVVESYQIVAHKLGISL